jgi:putative phosphotransacetylase
LLKVGVLKMLSDNEILKIIKNTENKLKSIRNDYGEKKMEKKIKVSVSNRHLHISQKDLETLFGKGYELTKLKDLSQPDQFACNEIVTIVGPKRQIEKVRILGPVRPETQVEVSVTDCYTLGIKPILRQSGDIKGSSGIKIVGPKGEINLNEGAIVAARHLHLHTDDAKRLNLKDKDIIKIMVDSVRPVVFDDVLVRVNEKFAEDFHIDTDEANAGLIDNNSVGYIL